MKQHILNMIYPRRCPVCGEPVRGTGLICPDCESRFSVVHEPTCFKCGKKIARGERELCFECETLPKAFTRCFALFNYDETAARSVLQFKNGGRREYAEYYAARFMELRGEQLRAVRAEAVVPVPVHKTRLAKRGYNQAAEFGRFLADALGIPLREDLLFKVRSGEEQKSLSAAGRARNVASTLQVSPEAGAFSRVLLVDDVYTTGSTLSACARALTRAGVREVCCAVISISSEE